MSDEIRKTIGKKENLSHYAGMFFRAKTLPVIAVTKDKLIEMLVESGKTQDEIDVVLTTMSVLRSQIQIGDQMVSIKEE